MPCKANIDQRLLKFFAMPCYAKWIFADNMTVYYQFQGLHCLPCGFLCEVMTCHIVMSWHVMSKHAMLYHPIPCHAMPHNDVLGNDIISGCLHDILTWWKVACHAMSCHVMMPCHAMPYHVIYHDDISCHIKSGQGKFHFKMELKVLVVL